MDDKTLLTKAEKRFRLWMWLSFLMYALGTPLFLLLGRQVAALLNGLPGSLVQRPPWPAAGEGMEVVFWQVLGVSLMVILAFVCLNIARDVRRYGPMIVALLGAKMISTCCYGVLFIGSANWAYLVAALTDGLIFLISWALWYLAAPADQYLDEKEQRILRALGDTLLPRGGAFKTGYGDVAAECLAEAQKLLAVQSPVEVLFSRLMLRATDLMPFCLGWFGPFHRLDRAARCAFFERLEHARFSPIRMMAMALKLYVVAPFFNLPGVAEEAGQQ